MAQVRHSLPLPQRRGSDNTGPGANCASCVTVYLEAGLAFTVFLPITSTGILWHEVLHRKRTS